MPFKELESKQLEEGFSQVGTFALLILPNGILTTDDAICIEVTEYG